MAVVPLFVENYNRELPENRKQNTESGNLISQPFQEHVIKYLLGLVKLGELLRTDHFQKAIRVLRIQVSQLLPGRVDFPDAVYKLIVVQVSPTRLVVELPDTSIQFLFLVIVIIVHGPESSSLFGGQVESVGNHADFGRFNFLTSI